MWKIGIIYIYKDAISMDKFRQAEKILSENIYCCIATTSKAGSPWNTPVFYSYDQKLNLYWASAIDSMHSQNLKENPSAFIVIYNSSAAPRTATALYLQGQVNTVADHHLDEIVQRHFKRVNEDSLFTGDYYRDSSPERLYQFNTQKAWILGKPMNKERHSIDTRKELCINELKSLLKKKFLF